MSAVLLLPLALAVSAPALKDRPKNANRVEGEWVVEQVTVAGRAQKPADLVYTFTTDGKWVIHRDGRELIAPNRRYTADPKTRPAAVVLMANATQPATHREGIYKVDGDTLTMCVGPPKGARPDRFESSQDDRNTIYVLKRKKK